MKRKEDEDEKKMTKQKVNYRKLGRTERKKKNRKKEENMTEVYKYGG